MHGAKLAAIWGEPLTRANEADLKEWIVSFHCKHGERTIDHGIDFVIKEQGIDVDDIGGCTSFTSIASLKHPRNADWELST